MADPFHCTVPLILLSAMRIKTEIMKQKVLFAHSLRFPPAANARGLSDLAGFEKERAFPLWSSANVMSGFSKK